MSAVAVLLATLLLAAAPRLIQAEGRPEIFRVDDDNVRVLVTDPREIDFARVHVLPPADVDAYALDADERWGGCTSAGAALWLCLAALAFGSRFPRRPRSPI
jgi:hypothetical protein